MFKVEARGKPAPRYQWRVKHPNDKEFHDTEGGVAAIAGVYEISQVKSDDAGQYYCDVVNTIDGKEYRVSSDVVELRVNHPPRIREQGPLTLDAARGEHIELNATDEDKEDEGQLTWGLVVTKEPSQGTVKFDAKPDGHVRVRYTPNENARGQDSFVVQVSDPLGVGDSVLVNVSLAEKKEAQVTSRSEPLHERQPESPNPSPPDLTLQPSNKLVCPGTSVDFRVEPAREDWSYQWWRLDEAGKAYPLNDRDGQYRNTQSATLTVVRAEGATKGAYYCVVSDKANEAAKTQTNRAALELKPATVVTARPPDKACPGDRVTFAVEATGSGELSYQWEKDGIDLKDVAGKVAGVKTPKLEIENVGNQDVGQYRCRVRADCETVFSSPTSLTLKMATQVEDLEPQKVIVGDTAAFRVEATGEGTLQYQWHKDGKPLEPGTRCEGVKGETLRIKDVMANDAGDYRCEVRGGCGEPVFAAARLTVITKTKIAKPPTTQKVKPGGMAEFKVEATGEGLKFEWQKDGKRLEMAPPYSVSEDGRVLRIDPVDSDAHAGTYVCKVAGEGGEAISPGADLVVEPLEDRWQTERKNAEDWLDDWLRNTGGTEQMPVKMPAKDAGRYLYEVSRIKWSLEESAASKPDAEKHFADRKKVVQDTLFDRTRRTGIDGKLEERGVRPNRFVEYFWGPRNVHAVFWLAEEPDAWYVRIGPSKDLLSQVWPATPDFLRPPGTAASASAGKGLGSRLLGEIAKYDTFFSSTKMLPGDAGAELSWGIVIAPDGPLYLIDWAGLRLDSSISVSISVYDLDANLTAPGNRTIAESITCLRELCTGEVASPSGDKAKVDCRTCATGIWVMTSMGMGEPMDPVTPPWGVWPSQLGVNLAGLDTFSGRTGMATVFIGSQISGTSGWPPRRPTSRPGSRKGMKPSSPSGSAMR